MARKLFSEADQTKIIEAIRLAEMQTSGEVRVHIEPNCKGDDPMARALEVFAELAMHTTAQQNGVLIYLATEDKKFAILGDKGIHEKVTDTFWNEEKEVLQSNFSNGEFTKGLTEAICKVGEKLKLYFPYQTGDSNELSNDISFGGEADA